MSHARRAAAAAGTGGTGRSRPSGTVMSWPWTRTPGSGSNGAMNGAVRREPTIARSRREHSPGASGAARSAASRIIRSKLPPARTAPTSVSRRPMCAWVRWTATSPTRHALHSDGAAHSAGERSSIRSARLDRSASMVRQMSSNPAAASAASSRASRARYG